MIASPWAGGTSDDEAGVVRVREQSAPAASVAGNIRCFSRGGPPARNWGSLSMEPDKPAGRHPNPRWSRRLWLPLSCAGLIVLCIVMLRAGPPRSHTVSRVIRDVHQVALKQPDGGLLGSWWISAKDIDPLTGELLSFTVECGPLLFGSKTARVVVDPDANTFEFVMRTVVVARADRQDGRRDGKDFVLDVDSYTLGPIPYHIDIVADDGRSRQRDWASLRSAASLEDD